MMSQGQGPNRAPVTGTFAAARPRGQRPRPAWPWRRGNSTRWSGLHCEGISSFRVKLTGPQGLWQEVKGTRKGGGNGRSLTTRPILPPLAFQVLSRDCRPLFSKRRLGETVTLAPSYAYSSRVSGKFFPDVRHYEGTSQ